MKLVTMRCVLLLGVVSIVASARAQTANGQSASAAGTSNAKQVYAQAKPYKDSSLPELKRAVPALDGLKADASQSDLQSILSRAGDVIQAQVPRMPDLTARESVSQAQFTIGSVAQEGVQNGAGGLMGAGRGAAQVGGMLQNSFQYTMDEKQLEQRLHTTLVTGTPWKDFDYLMLSRRSTAGSPMLDESRTDLKAPNGARPGREQKMLHGIGFGYLWLLFLPENVPQSSYRYLGHQKMYGQEAYVVAFAQLPDLVKVPGEITAPGMTYPLLYQGIAWIDEATFRIVRLRTDLLAPLPRIHVQRLTSDLRFSEVRIPELNLPLWLPNQVEVMWQQGDQMSGEMHLYTKYRLFHATAKVLPPS